MLNKKSTNQNTVNPATTRDQRANVKEIVIGQNKEWFVGEASRTNDSLGNGIMTLLTY